MKRGERVALAPAFILHRHAWRESSSILEIFSREHGRFGMVALGARRPKTIWRAWLRPFQPLLLSWVEGRELATLTGAEPQAPAAPLSADALMSGYYLNELLLRLVMRHDPQPELYDCYARALGALAESVRPVLRRFEKELLAALGYGLSLERDAASGKPLEAGGWYRYAPERGPLRVAAPDGTGLVVHGATLLALASGNLLQPEVLREAQQVTRAMLDVVLDGRPLRTREVMRGFGRLHLGDPRQESFTNGEGG
ncbi:MAG: DNA repair protein RecO [Gammaproteobacteria bacterium]